MDRLGTLKQITAEAARGELSFSTSAEVLLRIQRELEDPNCQVSSAVRLIQAEPLLSARLVAVANSAAFNRSERTISDVRAAVSLLGFRTVRTLATALVVKQLAGKLELPAHRDFATKLWEHSAHVAALAHLIAPRVTGMDPETAMFGGMLHEIGGFYLLSRVGEFPGLLDGLAEAWASEETEDGAEEISPERELGSVMLAALAVPKPVIDGLEILWSGYLTFSPSTLGDTLLLADQLAPVKSPLFKAVTENPIEMDNSLDLIVELDNLSHILRESAAEVQSLTDALRH